MHKKIIIATFIDLSSMHCANKPFACIISFDSKTALGVGYYYIHLTDEIPKAYKY